MLSQTENIHKVVVLKITQRLLKTRLYAVASVPFIDHVADIDVILLLRTYVGLY